MKNQEVMQTIRGEVGQSNSTSKIILWKTNPAMMVMMNMMAKGVDKYGGVVGRSNVRGK